MPLILGPTPIPTQEVGPSWEWKGYVQAMHPGYTRYLIPGGEIQRVSYVQCNVVNTAVLGSRSWRLRVIDPRSTPNPGYDIFELEMPVSSPSTSLHITFGPWGYATWAVGLATAYTFPLPPDLELTGPASIWLYDFASISGLDQTMMEVIYRRKSA